MNTGRQTMITRYATAGPFLLEHGTIIGPWGDVGAFGVGPWRDLMLISLNRAFEDGYQHGLSDCQLLIDSERKPKILRLPLT